MEHVIYREPYQHDHGYGLVLPKLHTIPMHQSYDRSDDQSHAVDWGKRRDKILGNYHQNDKRENHRNCDSLESGDYEFTLYFYSHPGWWSLFAVLHSRGFGLCVFVYFIDVFLPFLDVWCPCLACSPFSYNCFSWNMHELYFSIDEQEFLVIIFVNLCELRIL